MEIDCQTVQQKLDSGEEFLLLDCREQDEHTLVNLPQATLLPMSEIQNRVTELESHKTSEIIVYCHHGMRSLQVAQWLKNQGYENTVSMAGGIDRWAVQIDDSLARY